LRERAASEIAARAATIAARCDRGHLALDRGANRSGFSQRYAFSSDDHRWTLLRTARTRYLFARVFATGAGRMLPGSDCHDALCRARSAAAAKIQGGVRGGRRKNAFCGCCWERRASDCAGGGRICFQDSGLAIDCFGLVCDVAMLAGDGICSSFFAGRAECSNGSVARWRRGRASTAVAIVASPDQVVRCTRRALGSWHCLLGASDHVVVAIWKSACAIRRFSHKILAEELAPWPVACR